MIAANRPACLGLRPEVLEVLRVSSVVPDFDETTKSVRSRSSEASSAPDRGGMRRVEDPDVLRAERAPDDLGCEARAAHPADDDLPRGRPAALLRELEELGHALPHPARLVEPAEPLRLVGARPDGGVAGPDPLDELGGRRGVRARVS